MAVDLNEITGFISHCPNAAYLRNLRDHIHERLTQLGEPHHLPAPKALGTVPIRPQKGPAKPAEKVEVPQPPPSSTEPPASPVTIPIGIGEDGKPLVTINHAAPPPDEGRAQVGLKELPPTKDAEPEAE